MTATSFSLGDRMKRYEAVSHSNLMRRTPTIIRLDGKAFSSWTRNLKRPYDQILIDTMAVVMRDLVDNIQGAVFGFTQSDEISILIRDYDRLTTDMWFDGNIQKIVSVSASLATGFFNRSVESWNPEIKQPLAFFDARVFSLPKDEVTNYFLWRQQDCSRNSIQATGQAFLGHKNMQGMNNSQVQDALMALDTPINWNDYPIPFKRGVGYIKETGSLDFEIPLFKDSKDYINNLVYIKEKSND